jgi:DNA transposition AAA+ family ATPase
VDPIYFQTYQYYQARQKEVSDPTTLIVVDEADRLQMNSLEQVRSVFDSGDMGMILIGMPGIEKRIARFPQLYSRIGFVHEFRPLGAAEVQELLERCWTPPGVTLPDSGFTPEVVARLVRMTGGNLRLLTRLLTQVERSSKQRGTALSSAKPETRHPTTNNSSKATTNNSSPYSL